MPDNRIMRYIIYGIGTVALTEIAWASYTYLQELYINMRNNNEIHEVLMFNEVSDKCAAYHIQPIDSPAKYIIPNSVPTPPIDHCKNMHCAMRNIKRIVYLFDSAQYSLDIAVYTFTSHALGNAIKGALNRGVNVRIISDREMVYSSGSQINKLQAYNIPIRGPDTTYMMHHKFCIVDGEARVHQIMLERNLKNKPRSFRSCVLTGSVNWTKQGFGGNWENCLITSNREIAKQYQLEFDRMWSAFELR